MPLQPLALRRRAARIRLVVFDVDGVLTDGRLHYGPDGETFKVFHVHDGHGIKALKAAGVRVGLLSGRASDAVVHRARELDVDLLAQGAADKATVLQDWLTALALPATASAYLGDDLPDLPAMALAGLAAAVADAHPAVRARADYVTTAAGGAGAARELCDLLLEARGG